MKLVSLNIERSKHLELIIPFLQKQNADVVCLQELFERDIPRLEAVIGPCVAYGVSGPHPADAPEEGSFMEGTGIFSRHPVVKTNVGYYAGSEEHARNPEVKTVSVDLSLVSCTLQTDSGEFAIATTHGLLTQQGMVTQEQLSSMSSLMRLLENSGEFVLCGDFNAPRGKEAFALLSEKYKDTIPSQYETSIDIDMHRAGKLRPEELKDKMVDGLFTTPAYTVSDVELHSGVSDHLAITARIEVSGM